MSGTNRLKGEHGAETMADDAARTRIDRLRAEIGTRLRRACQTMRNEDFDMTGRTAAEESIDGK